ncbi:MAG: sulfatase [Deltaproteobacteria bacterium]|nr:sulfatase [Deltaproteobacteria bacterium]
MLCIKTLSLISVACSLLLALSCSSESTPAPGPKQENSIASKKPEVHTPPTAAKESLKPPSPDHLPGPRAYFGEIALKRHTEATQIESRPKSSVVLVVIDALNAKHLGIYGYDRPTTPNLDKLAGRGLLLSNHVSNSSWTRPSFTTIIAGLPKSVHGVELGGRRLEMEITTLAEHFKKAGYRTAGFVGNPLVREIWGFGQGFQTYIDTKTLDKAFPPDSVLVDRALRWLKKVGEKPFFLMLFLTGPHVPYRPPTRHKNYLAELPKGPVIQYPFKEYLKPLPKMDHARMVAAYDGDVAYSDEQVGRLVEFLESSGRISNTSLLITADHGEVFGHNNCYVHAYHMWEPALRVPFILFTEALSSRGIYDDRPFTHVDIVPTLLDLAGLPIPPLLTGVSIVKALADLNVGRDRILFSQFNAHGIRRQAIRKGSMKLIHHHDVDLADLAGLDKLHTKIPQPDPKDLPSLAVNGERFELYDLSADSKEERDIFDSHREDKNTKELLDALSPYLSGKSLTPALSDETLKALRAAGYIK